MKTVKDMIKIALVDDSELYAKQFKELVDRYRTEKGEAVELYYFDNGFDFLEKYTPDFNVVFLDIEMPHMDGLTVAHKLREIDATVPLIFVTVMSQLAIRGYEVSAMDFIVKPISYFNFTLKLEKALEIRKRTSSTTLKLLDDDGTVMYVAADEIYYVESFGHRCEFNTKKGLLHVYGSMSKIEQQLSADDFLRCNNSFVVNPAYIVGVKKDIILVGDREVPIARARKKYIMEQLAKYFKHRYTGD